MALVIVVWCGRDLILAPLSVQLGRLWAVFLCVALLMVVDSQKLSALGLVVMLPRLCSNSVRFNVKFLLIADGVFIREISNA